MDAQDWGRVKNKADELLSRRRARQITHDQVMSDLWAYADMLEVEALLKRLGMRWTGP